MQNDNKGKQIVEKVLATFKDWFGDEANVHALLECYKYSGEAVPSDSLMWNDESLEYSITDKIRLIFDAIARQLEEDFDIEDVSLCIEPRYDDASYIVMLAGDKVLYKDWLKVWNFAFSNLSEIEKYVGYVYESIVESISKQNIIFAITAKEVQEVAKEVIGRKLTKVELRNVKRGIESGLDSWPEVVRVAVENYKGGDD